MTPGAAGRSPVDGRAGIGRGVGGGDAGEDDGEGDDVFHRGTMPKAERGAKGVSDRGPVC